MSDITLVGTDFDSINATTSNLNVDMPGTSPGDDILAGDVAIIITITRESGRTCIPTTGTWVEEDNSTHGTDGANVEAFVHSKVLDGSETSITLTTTGAAADHRGRLYVFRGVDTASPLDVALVTVGDGTYGNNTNPGHNNADLTPLSPNGAFLIAHIPEGNPTLTAAGAPTLPKGMSAPDWEEVAQNCNIITSYKLDYGRVAPSGFGTWTHSYSGSDFIGGRIYTIALRAKRESKVPFGPAVIRKPWTKQPPQGTKIDWSNPLTRELVFFAPDGNLGVDVVGGLRMSPGPSAPVLHHVAFTAHPYMDGYAFDNTAGTRDGFHSTDLSDAILNKEGASGWTSMCFASINSFVDFHQIFGIREDTSPWYQCSLTRHNSTAADIQMTVQGSGGNDLVNAGAACDNFLPSGQTADLAQLVVTHQNTGSATRFTSYKNGVLFGTQTSGSGRDIDFAGLTTPSVSIGAWDETADRGIMIGTACAMWARELSAAEVSALYSNPWQVFKPKTFYVGATEKRKLVMF